MINQRRGQKNYLVKKLKKNKILKQKADKLLIEKKKEERIHEIKIDSILPPTINTINTINSINTINTINTINCIFSRESSVSTSTDSVSTSSLICKPSSDATEWREKQIKYGKNTIGYKSFINKYPNKDLRFRLNNNLISTPDKNEKIGKKRWVGKYQKWRKFLHKFDFDEFQDDNNDNNEIDNNKDNDNAL